jgi:hypothetical protein
MQKKKPCSICRRWFRPDARVGARQRACGAPECQKKRRAKTQARWRAKHPDYFTGRRLMERKAGHERGDGLGPPRMPRPLDRLPWEVAQDEFGPQGADFLGVFGRLLVRDAQDEREAQALDST